MRPWLARQFRSWLRPTDKRGRGDHAEPGRTQPPATRFVILFPGRTGSSHLVSCLSRHPQVHAEGEKLVGLDAAGQRAYLDALYGRARPAPVAAVGFKTKLKDLAMPVEFGELLVDRGVRIVTLLRRNRVKLAVSTLNARRIHAERGRWNLVAGEPQLSPLEATPDEIIATIERVDRSQRDVAEFAALLPLPRLELAYEGLLASQETTIARLEEFLGVESRPLVGAVEKATDDDLRRSVLHFDALAERLRETPYAADLGLG